MKKKLINISELSIKLDLIDPKNKKPANHIIRFWEKEFAIIRPIILEGNRRYYDEKQVKIISFIKFLLRDKGLTIKGVKKILNDKKKVDGNNTNNIESDYYKENIKNKSKSILEKIKQLKKYG